LDCFRIHDIADGVDLRPAGATARAAEDSWRVRIDDEGTIVAGWRLSEGHDDLAVTLRKLLRGTLRWGSAEELELAETFPDDEAGMALALYAPAPPGPEPERLPLGLVDACWAWEDSRELYPEVLDGLEKFIGHPRVDDMLVRDMLWARGQSKRGACAAQVLRAHQGEHITAALVQRTRIGRGDGHRSHPHPRVAALRSLVQRDPSQALPGVALEAVAGPMFEDFGHLLLPYIDAGELPDELANRPRVYPAWFGWEPFDLQKELQRRGLDGSAWLAAEEDMLRGHEGWIASLSPTVEPSLATSDICATVHWTIADRLASLVPFCEPRRIPDGRFFQLLYDSEGIALQVAKQRQGIVTLAVAAAAEGRVDAQYIRVTGPGGTVDIELDDTRQFGARSEMFDVILPAFGGGASFGRKLHDLIERARAWGYLNQVG